MAAATSVAEPLLKQVPAAEAPKRTSAASAAPVLLDSVVLLHTGSRAEVERAAKAVYASSAVFEGPLFSIKGRDRLVVSFVAFSAANWGNSVEGVSVLLNERGRLELELTLLYRLTPMGGILRVTQTTILLLDADGLVKAHRDEWHNAIGQLAVLPWPICYVYDLWRLIMGHCLLVLIHFPFLFAGAFCSYTLAGATLMCRMFDHCCAICGLGVASQADWRDLSMWGICTTLFDIRGTYMTTSSPPARFSEFQGGTAVVVGDPGSVLDRVAAELSARGAATMHLSSKRIGRMPSKGSPQSSGQSTNGPMEELRAGAITKRMVDFQQPGEVANWCRSFCELLGQRPCVNAVVLSPTAAIPKEQRFTNEALDHAFTADVVAMQALLVGLRPVLAPGARVVITASACCGWLVRPIHAEGLKEKEVPRASTMAAGGLQARAHQQAARVALAEHQARKWAAEPGGPVCVSCTPATCWSAWTDLLSWAGLLDSARSMAHRSRLLKWPVDQFRTGASVQIANNLVRLCRPEVPVVAGDYFWGQRCARSFAKSEGGMSDADMGRMLVVLALRSGQLPG